MSSILMLFSLFILLILFILIIFVAVIKRLNALLWGSISFIGCIILIVFGRLTQFIVFKNYITITIITLILSIIYQLTLIIMLLLTKSKSNKKDISKISCSNCGRILRQNMKFCPYCGKEI